jgi:transglutaminase-like putative cysteine protease
VVGVDRASSCRRRSTSPVTSRAGRTTRCCATARPRRTCNHFGWECSTTTAGASGRPARSSRSSRSTVRSRRPSQGPRCRVASNASRSATTPWGRRRWPFPPAPSRPRCRTARGTSPSPGSSRPPQPLAPTPQSSSSSTPSQPSSPPMPMLTQLGVDPSTLALDRRSEDEVRALLAELTDDGDSALEVARTVQAYLRSSQFTYSLELAEDDGTLPADPLLRFLETRRGYCVQFSTAMIMLTRAPPASRRAWRWASCPGLPDGDDRVVRVSDAHAWPELYFPQLGWVRFEPTPATQSNAAPDYSLEPSDPAAPRPRRRAPPRPRHPQRPRRLRRATSPTTAGWAPRHRWLLPRAVRHRQRPDAARHPGRRPGRLGCPVRGVAQPATGCASRPRRRRTGRGPVAVTAAQSR